MNDAGTMPKGRELVVSIVVLRLGVVRRIPLVIIDLILYLLLDLRMVLKAQTPKVVLDDGEEPQRQALAV